MKNCQDVLLTALYMRFEGEHMKKSVFFAVIGGLIGFLLSSMIKRKEPDCSKWRELSDKHLSLMLLMDRWVRVKQEEKSISSFLAGKGYKKIAVYGMSYVGETLVNELRGTEVDIVYGIDRNAKTAYGDVKVVSVDDDLPEVDGIVVTAVTYYPAIWEKLSKKVQCPILSLEDILYGI